jgi:hypothetical protein
MEGTLSDQNTIWQVLLTTNRAKLSGTLMLTTDNQLVKLQWQKGELEAIVWRNLKGQAALEKLLLVHTGQYRFMENLHQTAPQPDLPNVRDIVARAVGNTETGVATATTAPNPNTTDKTAANSENIARRGATGTLGLNVTAKNGTAVAEPVADFAPNFDLNRQILQKIHTILIDEVGKRAAEVMTSAAEAQGLSEQFQAGAIPRAKAREWIVQIAQTIRDPLNRTAFIRRAVEIAEL